MKSSLVAILGTWKASAGLVLNLWLVTANESDRQLFTAYRRLARRSRA
jgi:hypothetical protein